MHSLWQRSYERPSELISEVLIDDATKTEKKALSEEEKQMEDAVKDNTPKDFIHVVMFTTKGDDLYAFVCIYDEKSEY